ncbi:hypothetical protein [Rhizobium sp. 007]|uniref:hypothetical protein n=1 Tax=Rhizobium sp. 007 TaxID=2785056 RepID=UPI00188F90C7|nr:hypothetical protein [Rhizobium sp. 007]QPB24366.1 hypothetical protein ISN39_32990 [Rhizobium sp. 007]
MLTFATLLDLAGIERSAAKRLTLAETLFPEESRTTLRKAVDQAANEVWLASPASNGVGAAIKNSTDLGL